PRHPPVGRAALRGGGAARADPPPARSQTGGAGAARAPRLPYGPRPRPAPRRRPPPLRRRRLRPDPDLTEHIPFVTLWVTEGIGSRDFEGDRRGAWRADVGGAAGVEGAAYLRPRPRGDLLHARRSGGGRARARPLLRHRGAGDRGALARGGERR